MTQQLGRSGNPEDPTPEGTPGIAPPVVYRGRRGFLPFKTNAFDRIFISVICFIAIHLLWMRFVEAVLPLWIATALTLVLAFAIIRWG